MSNCISISIRVLKDIQIQITHLCVFKSISESGKPVNLSTNVGKHVLAELKHFHMNGLEKKEKDLTQQIPPPTWSPAVVKTVLGSRSNPSETLLALDSHAKEQSEEDSDSDTCIGSLGALAKIDQEVAQVSSQASINRGGVHVAEYIDAIGELSKDVASEPQDFHRPPKKPRGNHGFFMHLRDQKALTPRMPNEPYKEYHDRLMVEARRTWEVIAPVVRENVDIGNNYCFYFNVGFMWYMLRMLLLSFNPLAIRKIIHRHRLRKP